MLLIVKKNSSLLGQLEYSFTSQIKTFMCFSFKTLWCTEIKTIYIEWLCVSCYSFIPVIVCKNILIMLILCFILWFRCSLLIT